MSEPHPGRPIGEESDDDLPLHQPRKPVTELRKPSTVGGVCYLFVLAAALVGVVIAATGAWRSGVSWLGLSLLGGAAARIALSTEVAGMLEVRRKSLDVAILVVLGVSLLFLAATIPDQPPT
ncbi:DUF3017 domain-containing protein [Nocardioides daejeonensis]|uniref:DUF3017 domain-containing protein n=1 Tax=Nocardioides daejeonensis TaxID=1046556 RepID=UPI0013A58122|nr:DUF3017 domain-containing protein [Nocardioides daejeonensis]